MEIVPVKRARTTFAATSKVARKGLRFSKKKNAVAKLVVPRFGFPLQKWMRHRYVNYFAVTGTTALQQVGYYANGMYQPSTAGATHQPMYFDNMTAIYDHYTVMKAKCVWRIASRASNTADQAATTGYWPCIIVAHIDDDATPPATILACTEQSTATHKLLNNNEGTQTVITKYWDGKKYFGGNLRDNDNLQGTVTGNPSELSTFFLSFLSSGGSNAYLVTVEIEYEAMWDELKSQEVN